MPGKSNPYCPLKFTSKTLTEDGYVRKATSECEEELCGWWRADKKCCAIMILAEGVDLIHEMHKLERVKLQLMLASGEDKEAMQAIVRAHPYLKLAQDAGEVLK